MPDLDSSITEVGKKMKIFERKSLRILQWNSDKLSTKVGELTLKLKELDIDLVMIQESKLEKKDATAITDGYKGHIARTEKQH